MEKKKGEGTMENNCFSNVMEREQRIYEAAQKIVEPLSEMLKGLNVYEVERVMEQATKQLKGKMRL